MPSKTYKQLQHEKECRSYIGKRISIIANGHSASVSVNAFIIEVLETFAVDEKFVRGHLNMYVKEKIVVIKNEKIARIRK